MTMREKKDVPHIFKVGEDEYEDVAARGCTADTFYPKVIRKYMKGAELDDLIGTRWVKPANVVERPPTDEELEKVEACQSSPTYILAEVENARCCRAGGKRALAADKQNTKREPIRRVHKSSRKGGTLSATKAASINGKTLFLVLSFIVSGVWATNNVQMLDRIDDMLTDIQNKDDDDFLEKDPYLNGNYQPVSETHRALSLDIVEGSIPGGLDGKLISLVVL